MHTATKKKPLAYQTLHAVRKTYACFFSIIVHFLASLDKGSCFPSAAISLGRYHWANTINIRLKLSHIMNEVLPKKENATAWRVRQIYADIIYVVPLAFTFKELVRVCIEMCSDFPITFLRLSARFQHT